MNLLSKLFLLFAAVLCLSFQADRSGTIDKKSRALIAAYIQKIGGYEAIKNIKSIKITGKYIWTESGEEMVVEYCVKKPGRVRYTYYKGGEVSLTCVYNNGKAVRIMNGKKEPL